MGLAALLLAASTLLSRLMGLVRDKVISWQFGATQEADMYFAAFVVPDCINYLLAGGFMSITIIPLLSRCFKDGQERAWPFFSCVFTWLTAASIVLTGISMIFAEELASVVAPGFSLEERCRLAFFMRIILPAQIFFLSGSCFMALLFLRKQFTIPALSPLVYNGTIILGGLLVPAVCSLASGQNYHEALSSVGMAGYCLGVPIGACIGAFLLPFLAARKGSLHLSPTFRHPLFKTFLLTALPLMLGQTVIMLDEQFLRIFGSMLSEGSVSLLNYARRLTQVPIGLVGQASAVASYPFLVDLLTKDETARFNETLQKAFRGGLVLIIPAASWMFANSFPIFTLIFQGGRFGETESLGASPLLQIMLLAVPLWMLYMVLVRAFYAYGDTITPALTGTIVTVLVVPIYYFISARTSTEAIAITSAASVSLYVLWLFCIWTKRHGNDATKGLLPTSSLVLLLSLPPAFCSYLVQSKLMAILPFSHVTNALLALSASGILFLLLFLPFALRFLPELRTYIIRIAKRCRRKA
ncbi:MAG: murein biosynthesis integral membrane protein MurJ [Desulfovibrio sp.]|nr:murein biosynthesis integral membrane protein MurJ [Desulfovibrio sp.]